MFDRLRKALQRAPRQAPEGPPSQQPAGPVSEWASSRGMSFSSAPRGGGISMQGKVGGRTWRMELGRPTRDYIAGEELRARAELGIPEGIAAMVINRPLKETLERRAYSLITDTLQTTADPRLPEEMRWLAMYDEIGWEGVDPSFWQRFSVLSDRRETVLAWVDASLVRQLTRWPQPAPAATVPFMVVLLRGKCYLRMQYLPAQTSTLEHAAAVFTGACENALKAFRSK